MHENLFITRYRLVKYDSVLFCTIVNGVFASMVKVALWENKTPFDSNLWRFSSQNDVRLLLYL